MERLALSTLDDRQNACYSSVKKKMEEEMRKEPRRKGANCQNDGTQVGVS
jgi:hypothetical protein